MSQALAVSVNAPQRLDPSVVRVGKDIVELVTSGMYLSPITIYREYVQNSADAIELGIKEGLIKVGEGSVAINIDHGARSVRIVDNGIGIKATDAASLLLAIGGSAKRGTGARGFRGIGRLSGIAYCKALHFRTRAAGEDTVSVVEWDCKRLRQRLSDDSFEGDLHSVITSSVRFLEQPARGEDPSHFFEVTMVEVARHRGDILLNEATIRDYLGQVAPVDFSERFSLGAKIRGRLADHGVDVGIVDLSIQGERVLRPYANVTTFPGNLFELKLDEVEFFEFANIDGEVAAVGWVAHHQYARSIPPSLGIGRLRARIGDVQIGGEGVFDEVFKETRFNGWCVGEIHILDRRIQPNGRRDHFELNHHAYNLLAQLGPKAIELSHRCRTSSISRNILLMIQNLVEEIEKKLAESSLPSKGEISRFRGSIERARGRLKNVDHLEARELCEAALSRVSHLLDQVPSDSDGGVIALDEVSSLVRSIVTNRDQARKLLEALQSVAS
ncbi:ATP-binding protein [Jiella pacifica]|uniref:Molecular chaperone Hsp90 n=1 Tax=Jiella pacifica TaxID=2696469 RepID=A0A6N9T3C7_9HYPH|nr:ATP-binding protein [Jiella pacifica]NDW05873.1 molecular chaperone Hsp90 [Jiella pacifica]